MSYFVDESFIEKIRFNKGIEIQLSTSDLEGIKKAYEWFLENETVEWAYGNRGHDELREVESMAGRILIEHLEKAFEKKNVEGKVKAIKKDEEVEEVEEVVDNDKV